MHFSVSLASQYSLPPREHGDLLRYVCKIDLMTRSSRCVSLTVELIWTGQHAQPRELKRRASERTVTPPAAFCLKTTSGGREFRRIPTASNSISSNLFCSADFVASTAADISDEAGSSVLAELTHEHNQICRLCDGYDLSSSSSTWSSACLSPNQAHPWRHPVRYRGDRAAVYVLPRTRVHPG